MRNQIDGLTARGGLHHRVRTAAMSAVLTLAVAVAAPAVATAHYGFHTSFGNGQLSFPVGVAVEESSGGILVGNFGSVGNDKFDVSHALVSPPSPFPETPEHYSGISINPVSEDIYVLNTEEINGPAIDTFDPKSGALLSSFPVTGAANIFGTFAIVQIASDATGNVYVPSAPSNEIQVFNATGGAPTGGVSAIITGSGASALKAPEGVAVDSTGRVWVADTGDGRIEEFEASGTFMKEIASPGVQAVAVDAAGDVFASVNDDSGAHVIEYNSNGTQIDDFGLGVLHESGFGTVNGVAIDNARELVYVADGGDNLMEVFATWGVATGQASGISETGATFSGTVEMEPGSKPVTSCKFEYGTTPAYGNSAPCSPGGPYSSANTVDAIVNGLGDDTEYHFRIIAGNASGAIQAGEDKTLITPGPPTIDEESAEATTTSGVIRAQIDPFGFETTCDVQYVTEAAFNTTGYAEVATAPCAGAVGAGFGDKPVSVSLAGLRVGTVYHYRFVATNKAGTTTGADGTFATFGIKTFSLAALNSGLIPVTQAGAHPYVLADTFSLNTSLNQFGNAAATDANPKIIRTELPPGFIGNPEATAKCSPYNVAHADCSGASQVGIVKIVTSNVPTGTVSPIYNLVPPKGLAAQFGARFNGFVTVHIDARLRSGGDYGVTAEVLESSAGEGVIGASATFWGVPAEESHDKERYCPSAGKVNEVANCHERGTVKPFLTTPTSCGGALEANMSADSWQYPEGFVSASSQMPAMTGCGKLDFKPTIAAQPDGDAADSPVGVHVDLHVPQIENPVGLAESDVKDAEVRLPAGVTLNPAGAVGLVGCSEAQIELHSPEPAQCPDASKIGSVEIVSPLVDHPVKGSVYVAQQGNDGPAQGSNQFGSLVAVYIAVDDPETGVVVKLAGKVRIDPMTGQVATTFDENPQLPFEELKLELFDGPHAALATPSACGVYKTTSVLEPWSHQGAPGETGTPDTEPYSDLSITSGPGGAPCSSLGGFAPGFVAGTQNNAAASFSPFVVSLTRKDGEQVFSTVALTMPPGLAGDVSAVTLCPEAQANAGDCPASSKIGHVRVSAGVGNEPIVLPEAGKPEDPVYLTGPYAGAPFGLSVVVPAEAGPFNLDEGGRPIVVRAKVEIDPHTGQVTVVSDPQPTRLQGIPLDVRSIEVVVDKQGFIFNPTRCDPMSVTGAIGSSEGASEGVSSRFQAASCASLPFKPSFAAATAAKHTRSGGDSLHVVVKSTPGQANIAAVHVELPRVLPSRLSTINQACPEGVFASDPAACPPGSRIGTAIAYTPVLSVPLTGPAYFVSHGGAKFPELILVLQGEGVTVQLNGETFISKAGVTSSTFGHVPDVPVSRFELNLPSGPDSVLSANGDLCAGKLSMPTTITAQNGVVVRQLTHLVVDGCKPAIRVLRHSFRGDTATIVASVPSAGRLVASGSGLSRVKRELRKAGSVTLTLVLTNAERALLAHHPGRQLKVSIELKLTPAHGSPLSSRVSGLIG